MKTHEIKYFCDRCNKEVTENEYMRKRRKLFVDIREERKYRFTREWKSLYSHSDSFELCEECRANLELWLEGKNVTAEQEG